MNGRRALRPGSVADLGAAVALTDGAVAWSVTQPGTGQRGGGCGGSTATPATTARWAG